MIAVFFSALILEVFTIYSVAKDLFLKSFLDIWMYVGFFMMILFLVLPKFVTIHQSIKLAKTGQKLENHLRKCLDGNLDDVTYIKVRYCCFVPYYLKIKS